MGSDDTGDATVSRRAVLGGAGAAIVGGLVAGHVAASGAADAASPSGVARGHAGTMVVEFRGRIQQTGSNGQDFTCLGYLTRANGLADSDLFAGSTRSETTARFTALATGHLVSRVLDQSVHLLDVAGDLVVHERAEPGASWSDPDSFTRGAVVARYSLTIQDVLSVFAPAKGMLELTGDMVQTFAGTVSAGTAAGRRFGRVDDRLRQHGTGLGTLVDPVTLNADLEIAGSWTSVEQPGG